MARRKVRSPTRGARAFRAFWFQANAGDQIDVTATSSNGTAAVLVADDTFRDVPGNADSDAHEERQVLRRDPRRAGAHWNAQRHAETHERVVGEDRGRVGRSLRNVRALDGNGRRSLWGRRSNDFFTNGSFSNYSDRHPRTGQMPADHRFLPSHRYIGFDFAGTTPRSWQTAIESSMNDYSNMLVYSEAFFTTLDGTSPLALLSSECAWFPGRIRCRKQGTLVDFDFDGETFTTGAIGSRREFACAITPAKDLKCWGGNYLGRLGTGDAFSRGVGDPDQDAHADLTRCSSRSTSVRTQRSLRSRSVRTTRVRSLPQAPSNVGARATKASSVAQAARTSARFRPTWALRFPRSRSVRPPRRTCSHSTMLRALRSRTAD